MIMDTSPGIFASANAAIESLGLQPEEARSILARFVGCDRGCGKTAGFISVPLVRGFEPQYGRGKEMCNVVSSKKE